MSGLESSKQKQKEKNEKKRKSVRKMRRIKKRIRDNETKAEKTSSLSTVAHAHAQSIKYEHKHTLAGTLTQMNKQLTQMHESSPFQLFFAFY